MSLRAIYKSRELLTMGRRGCGYYIAHMLMASNVVCDLCVIPCVPWKCKYILKEGLSVKYGLSAWQYNYKDL